MTAPPIQHALDLHRQGQLDQAALLYAQILEQEPANFAALQFLGVLRGQQGRYAEALRLIESALKLQPRDFGALANYGQTLMAAGRLSEALAAFDRALAVRPDFFEALYNKATVLAQMKRFAEAVSHLRQGADASPKQRFVLLQSRSGPGGTGAEETRHWQAMTRP